MAATREGHLPETLQPNVLRLAAAMFWGSGLATLATLLPGGGIPHANRPVVAASALLSLGGGLVAWNLPRRRGRSRVTLLTAAALALIAPALLASGGARSPLYILLPLPVTFAAAYFGLPQALRFTVAAILIGALPIVAEESDQGIRILMILIAVLSLLAAFQRLLVQALQRETSQKEAMYQLAESRRGDLESTYLATLRALTAALDAKDRYTEAHGRETAALCIAVGRRLGLSDEHLRYLEYGALLHDIGKIGIPGAVLNKPGPLTTDEWAMIREHPVIGERILAPVPFLQPVLPLVRGEHERWDGTGYPDGLKGEAIPLGARIIFACDAFDAMSRDRAYRRALPREQVLAELRRNAGTQFDPRVVDVLIAAMTEGDQLVVPQAAAALPWGGGRLTGPGSWAQHLDTVQALGIRLARINSVSEISLQIGEAIVRLIEHDQCRIWVLNNDLLIPTYASVSNRPEYRNFHARSFRVGEGIVGWVGETRQGLVVGDANKHPRRVRFTNFDESVVAVPVVFADELLGVIAVIKIGLNQYNGDHLRLLTILAHQAAVSIANARMYERLTAEASTDSLTGLLNRRAMQGRIQEAVAKAAPFSLLLADIDQLKSVNDEHGHMAGDEALVAVAESARSQLGESALLSRWAGDEFLGLLPGCSVEEAHQRGRRLQETLRTRVLAAAPQRRLALSFGVAHYPSDGTDATVLLVAADRAMYAAKPTRPAYRAA